MGSIHNSDNNKCPICGRSNIDISSYNNGRCYCYTCPKCGEFFAPGVMSEKNGFLKNDPVFIERLQIYLFYHKSNMRPFICSEEYYAQLDKSKFVNIYNLSQSMINAWYPKSFAEKIDLILLKLNELSEYDGAYIRIEDSHMEKLFFCSNCQLPAAKSDFDISLQIDYVYKFLKNNEYIVHIYNNDFQLTPKALERIYELRKNQTNNKNVFVSMAFNDDTRQTREAIRNAIINSGYSPEFIDEIIHNKQIVPEMFRLIRECRFLILDISDPNYGAYYEAGYALGLGKEVIICCSDEVFRKDFGIEDKYKKPHFDIAQKQILIWSDFDDLTKKLTEWIKSIVG